MQTPCTMDLCRRTLGFLLLLPLILCFKNQKVFLEKRIRSEADVTPLCTVEYFMMVLCKVPNSDTEKLLCSLRYIPEQSYKSECSPKIKLMVKNQTVSLYLMKLTPEDSGVYFCECVREEGISKLHLNVTVEDFRFVRTDQIKSDDMIIIYSSVAAFIVIIIFVFTVGCVYKRRKQSRPAVRDGEEMDTYTGLQKPDCDPYQTVGCRSSVSKQQLPQKDVTMSKWN